MKIFCELQIKDQLSRYFYKKDINTPYKCPKQKFELPVNLQEHLTKALKAGLTLEFKDPKQDNQWPTIIARLPGTFFDFNHYIVSYITPKGGFTKHKYFPETFDHAIKDMLAFKPPEVIKTSRPKVLPEPMKFVETGIEARYTNLEYQYKYDEVKPIQSCVEVSSSMQLNTVTIINVVTISDDLEITGNVDKPEVNAWYFCLCHNKQGAKFEIVTDGDVFYFIKKNQDSINPKKKRRFISNSVIPKKSIDLTKMNIWDRQLLQMAIKFFVKEVTK